MAGLNVGEHVCLVPFRDILTAATERGDLAFFDNVDEVATELAGPLFTRHIMLRTTIGDQLR